MGRKPEMRAEDACPGRKPAAAVLRAALVMLCLTAVCSAGAVMAAEVYGPSADAGSRTEAAEGSGDTEIYGPSFQQSRGTDSEPAVSTTPTPEVSATPTPGGSAAPTPGVSVTPEPTPTIAAIAPEQQTASQEEGTISKPDHPDTVTNDKLILIGDSRTEGIRDAVSDVATDTVFSCLSGMGYDWMVSTGVPEVEDQIEKNTAVVFLMGVNDPYNLENYITYINEKAYEWAAIGAQTYYAAVGPVESDPYITNTQIESFNDSMENSLSGVKFIDVYTHLTENGYSTTDGLHYTTNVSIDIYNYIVENLEEVRSGIWG